MVGSPAWSSQKAGSTTPDHLVYGSDSGVPCSTEATMEANKRELLAFDGITRQQVENIGRNALALFPSAAARMTDRAILA
jgi:hypothetical protein